jgi:hypothetical protein
MATNTEDKTRASRTSPHREADEDRNERRRAAAYLDLWERHLSISAVHGERPAEQWFEKKST